MRARALFSSSCSLVIFRRSSSCEKAYTRAFRISGAASRRWRRRGLARRTFVSGREDSQNRLLIVQRVVQPRGLHRRRENGELVAVLENLRKASA